MNATVVLLNELGRWLASQLGRMSVELAILAGVVLVALYLLRVKSPALRHLFWGLLLAKPVVTFLVASPLSLYAFFWPSIPEVFYTPVPVSSQIVQVPYDRGVPVAEESPSPEATRSPATPPFWRRIDRYGFLSVIWALTAGAFGLRLLLGCAYVAFLRGTALTQREGPLAELVTEAGQPFRLWRQVSIATTRVAHGPILAGIFRPVILLPEGMAEALTLKQLKLVITHELAHAKRWDNLVLLIQRFAEMFFFFHPVVWFCGWMMRREAEAACDDIVVAAYGGTDGAGAAAYADSLTRVAEMKCGITRRLLVNTFAAAESNFNRRIRRILSGRSGRMTLWLSLATGVAIVIIGVLGLPTASSAPLPEAAAANLEKTLDEPYSVLFEGPHHLKDVFSFIAAGKNDQFNASIDWRVVQIPGDMPASANSHAWGRKPAHVTDGIVPSIDIRNKSRREILDAILKPLGLSFAVKGHYVWISSPAMIEEDAGSASPESRNPTPELMKALSANGGIEFEDVYVRDILDYLAKAFGVAIVVDDVVVAPAPGTSGAAVASGDTSRYVTNGFVPFVHLKSMPLLEILEAVLRPLDLVAIMEDNQVRVTSYDRASGDKAETATPTASSAPPPGEVSDSAVEAEELFVLENRAILAHIRIRGVESWVCPGASPRGGYGLKEFTMDPPGVLLVRQRDDGTVRVPARQGAVRIELSAAPDTNGPILLRIEGADNRLSATIQPAMREEKPDSCRVGDRFGSGGYIVTEIDAKAGTVLLTDCNAKVAFRLALSGVVPRPEMAADLRARLTRQTITCTVDSVDSLLPTLSLASGLSVVVQDAPSFSPVSVSETHPLQLMEKVVEQSGGSFCFIVRPFGILVTSTEKARTLSGASIPSNVPYVTTPRVGDYSKRPRLLPKAMETALGRQPLTLSGRSAEIRLSSLVETLSLASELTFAMEKEVLLKPYEFTNLQALDIMAAISEMMQDQVCFVFRDYGILVTSRDTALKRSGPSIPDLPLEQLEETPSPHSPVPEDVKKLLAKESIDFTLRPEDVQPGGGSELVKAFSLASGLQLKIDTKGSEESQAEDRPEYARPYCFLANGNCLQLMQVVVEASNGVLSFVLADPSGFTLTDFEKARALPGPGIQEVPLRPVTLEKHLTPPDSPPSPEATPTTATETGGIPALSSSEAANKPQEHASGQAPDQAKGVAVPVTQSEGPDPMLQETASIEKELDKPISFTFDNKRLPEIVSSLVEKSGVSMVTDNRVAALQSGASGAEGLVPHIEVKDVSLREALRALLEPLNLEYRVFPGFIWVSTPLTLGTESFDAIETRYYELPQGQDVQEIVDLLQRAVPEVFEPGTGKRLSSMVWRADTGSLAVHNTPANCAILEGLLVHMPATSFGPNARFATSNGPQEQASAQGAGLRIQVMTVHLKAQGEFSLAEDIWKGGALPAKKNRDALAFFTDADVMLGSQRLIAKGNEWSLDGNPIPIARQDAQIEPPAKIQCFSAHLPPLAGKSSGLGVSIASPIEASVPKADGGYASQSWAQNLEFGLNCEPGPSGAPTVDVRITVDHIEKRKSGPGIPLDTGEPVFKKRKYAFRMCVQPGKDYGVKIDTGPNDACFLRVRMEVESTVPTTASGAAVGAPTDLFAGSARPVIQREGDRVWLDGVNGWSFGERISSVHAAAEAVMHAVGNTVSYDYLVGVSGLAFRMQVFKESLCPSSPHSCCGYRCVERSVQALPWDETLFTLKPGETEKIKEARKAIVASVERGIPVQYGSEEDGIVVGYQKDGDELICFNPMKEGGKKTYIEKDWPWGVAVYTGPKKEMPSRRDLAIGALEQAVKMADTEEADKYYVGFKAWRAYIDALTALDKADKKTLEGARQGNAWIYECLVSHRNSASRYLREIAPEFDKEVAEHLLKAADVYAAMATSILRDDTHSTMAIAPYPGAGKWTAEMRTEQVARLNRALSVEREAVQELKLGLKLTNERSAG